MKRARPTVDQLRQQVLETAALPLAQAKTLPPAIYTDADYFDYEVETVLKAGWQAIAHISQLKNVGDYVQTDLLGEPLLVTRAKDGAIRVLSRACPHRGLDVMLDTEGQMACGNAQILVCPYHRWSFELDGSLKGCPEMQQAEGFKKSDYPLGEFRSAIFEGFVFVNLSGDAEPIEHQYAGFAETVAPWNTAEMEIVSAMEWDIHANWKVMVENWAESYHHIGSHHTTLHQYMPAQNTWASPAGGDYLRAHLPYTEEFTAGMEAKAKAGQMEGFIPIKGLTREQETEWGVWIGYPCFMFLTSPDRTIWYRLQPISVDFSRLTTITLCARENFALPDFAERVKAETAMLAEFHQEDMVMYRGLQRGLNSVAAVQGRLSHLEDPIWQMQHYLARRIKADLASNQSAEAAE
jgi:phenylpropionate dioxygenase-like ring-hydroxylating dioxygenase large terminal subunit